MLDLDKVFIDCIKKINIKDGDLKFPGYIDTIYGKIFFKKTENNSIRLKYEIDKNKKYTIDDVIKILKESNFGRATGGAWISGTKDQLCIEYQIFSYANSLESCNKKIFLFIASIEIIKDILKTK